MNRIIIPISAMPWSAGGPAYTTAEHLNNLLGVDAVLLGEIRDGLELDWLGSDEPAPDRIKSEMLRIIEFISLPTTEGFALLDLYEVLFQTIEFKPNRFEEFSRLAEILQSNTDLSEVDLRMLVRPLS